jgi:hypothetical protein
VPPLFAYEFIGGSKPPPYDKGGSFCKKNAVLFTFAENYGIIQLMHKLEFDGGYELWDSLVG